MQLAVPASLGARLARAPLRGLLMITLAALPGCADRDPGVTGSGMIELDEVDVQDDEDLEREYGIRIPVVEIDGEERFQYEVDAEELTRIVRRA